MDWKWAVTTLAGNWAVILGSLPLFLILIGLLVWVTIRITQAFGARELRVQKGLRELAEKQEAIAKASTQALEKKLAEITPKPEKPAPPPDVVAVVSGQPVLRQAFEELNSTKGLHLSFDPRKDGRLQFYVSVDEQELERMAAARYFMDRGLVGFYKPDAMGTGVSITASTTAAEAYQVVSKLPKPDNK